MPLIDWYDLSANALWIAALALLLATTGYAWWQAGIRRESVRRTLARPTFQTAVNLCGVLFTAGAGLAENRIWAQALWALLGLGFAAAAAAAWRERRPAE